MRKETRFSAQNDRWTRLICGDLETLALSAIQAAHTIGDTNGQVDAHPDVLDSLGEIRSGVDRTIMRVENRGSLPGNGRPRRFGPQVLASTIFDTNKPRRRFPIFPCSLPDFIVLAMVVVLISAFFVARTDRVWRIMEPSAPRWLAALVRDPQPQRIQPRVVAKRRAIRVGSTKAEVRQVNGPPTKEEGENWYFGKSSVQFEGERVVAWTSTSQNPLAVEPWGVGEDAGGQ